MARNEMTIQPATQDDLAQIVRLVNAAYAKYLDRMEKPPAPLLADVAAQVARGDVYALASRTQIVGALVMGTHADAVIVENIALDPAFSGARAWPAPAGVRGTVRARPGTTRAAALHQ